MCWCLSVAHCFLKILQPNSISLWFQADVHAAYGGVVPNLAMEAHKAAMDSCVEEALQLAGVTAQDLQAIAVSIGPGLSPCLQVQLLVSARLAITSNVTILLQLSCAPDNASYRDVKCSETAIHRTELLQQKRNSSGFLHTASTSKYSMKACAESVGWGPQGTSDGTAAWTEVCSCAPYGSACIGCAARCRCSVPIPLHASVWRPQHAASGPRCWGLYTDGIYAR